MAESLEDKKKRLEVEKLEKEVNQYYPSGWFTFWQILFPLVTVIITAAILYNSNFFEINSKKIANELHDYVADTTAFGATKRLNDSTLRAQNYTIDSLNGVERRLESSIEKYRKDKSSTEQKYLKLSDENAGLRASNSGLQKSVGLFKDNLKSIDDRLNPMLLLLGELPKHLYTKPFNPEYVAGKVQNIHIGVNDAEKIIDSLRRQ